VPALRCPICGLFSPAESLRCDCGYRFKRRPAAGESSTTQSGDQALTHAERGILERRRSEAATLTWIGAIFIVASIGFSVLSIVAHVGTWIWLGGLIVGGGFLVRASRLRPPR
jgi:hypothetical protein